MKKVDKKFILNELYSSKVKTCEKCENSSGKQWTQEKKENTNQREFCTSLIFAQAIYSIKLVKWLQLIILPLWFDEKIVRTKSRLFPIKLVKWQQLFLIFLASNFESILYSRRKMGRLEYYRVSHIEMFLLNWLWQIEICKLDFVWRYLYISEVWKFEFHEPV